MQRDDALRLLRERREQLHELGVGQLFLYGSVARNQARDDSDVDLLVEPSNQRFSIFDLPNPLSRTPTFRLRKFRPGRSADKNRRILPS